MAVKCEKPECVICENSGWVNRLLMCRKSVCEYERYPGAPTLDELTKEAQEVGMYE